MELWCRKRFSLDKLLDKRNVSVINVCIGYYMNKLAYVHVADLRQHVHQNRILHNIPVVCSKHVLGSLIENCIECKSVLSLFLSNIVGYAVSARIQIHLMKVRKHIGICHDPAAERIVFEIINDPVHLVKLALFINTLLPNLIAVGFSDRAGLVSPLVPDVAVKVMDVIALFLIYPENLIGCALKGGFSQSHYWKLF